MFEAVLKLLLEDQLRSNRIVAYSICKNLAIYAAVEQTYNDLTKIYEGDLNDVTLAVEVADGIYNLIPSLL